MLKKIVSPIFCMLVLLSVLHGHAQTGSFTATFTPIKTGKPVTVKFSRPFFAYNNAHGYWFVNPHRSDRHINLQPDAGYGDADAGFITFTMPGDDVDFYEGGGNDSNSVALKTGKYTITAPEYDIRSNTNSPLHVHFDVFTASEVSFTLSGTARLGTNEGNGEWLGLGTISGRGHFYREPKYTQTEVMPSCACDPTVYGYVYDQENGGRTASACENALYNKVFDAVQKMMIPLFAKVNYNGPERPYPAGTVSVTILPQHVDISVPPKERAWCAPDYRYNRVAPLDAEKKFFTNDDAYGVRLMKIPSDAELNPGKDAQQKLMHNLDSMMKLFQAKKISYEEIGKFTKSLETNPELNKANADFKKTDMESSLSVTVILNPDIRVELKMGDKAHTVVQHTIKGAAFDIFSPAAKDEDGDWVANRQNIYIGKFSNPVLGKSGGGFDAELVNAIYPANSNKLTLYNVVIKLDGGKELIDKAVANIDFSAIEEIMAVQ